MEEKGQGGGVGHPSPPWHPGEHVHLLLMQGHRVRVFRRDFGFGKQNTVESKVRLALFVCFPWKHHCVLQEAGLKGYGSLCWAHRPRCLAEQPLGHSHGHVHIGCMFKVMAGHGLPWHSAVWPGPVEAASSLQPGFPPKLVPHFPQHQTGFRGQSPQYHP